MFTADNVTTLADIERNPAPLISAVKNAVAKINEFRTSGLVVNDPVLTAYTGAPGAETSIQTWGFDVDAPWNVGSDDPTKHAVPNKAKSRTLKITKNERNIGFSEMDLVASLMGDDPLADLTGLYANSKSENERAMIVAIIAGLSKTATSTRYVNNDKGFGREVMAQATGKLGNKRATLTNLIVPLDVYTQMQIAEGSAFVPASKSNIDFDTYMGKKLIVVGNDDLPSKTVSTTKIYTSVLAADGVFKFGEVTPLRAIELQRDANAGDGMGQSTYWMRVKNAVAPQGYSFIGDPAKTGGPSNTEYATAANWEQKSNAGLVFVEHALKDKPAV